MGKNLYHPYAPTHPMPPGKVLKLELESLCMTQKEFATRCGVSEKHVSQVIRGKEDISAEFSGKISVVLGGLDDFWFRLQSNYYKHLERIKREQEAAEELKILDGMPFDEMVERGYVPSFGTRLENLETARRYFQVVDLRLLPDCTKFVNCRIGAGKNKVDLSRAVWVQQVRLASQGVAVGEYSAQKLKTSFPKLKELLSRYTDTILHDVRKLFSEIGVPLVYLPNIGQSSMQGMMYWLTQNHPIIGLSLSGKRFSRFVFTLLHEVGHLYHKDKKNRGEINMTYEEGVSLEQELENRANEFARSFLIDKLPDRITDIKSSAEELGVHPALLASRLAYDKRLDWRTATQYDVKVECPSCNGFIGA